ncbi:MAG TPA: hypothetical protein VMZ11_00955 [Mycobacteriales bacterium]|nr:hypothetical protein [Mycobacteriales bacterium]
MRACLPLHRRLAVPAAVLVAAAVAAGCSDDKGPGSAAAPATSAPVVATPAVTAPPRAATPVELQGDWVATANRQFRLRLGPHAYSVIIEGTSEGHGDVGAAGHRLAFFNGRPCGTGTGWYVWTLKAGKLELQPSGLDPCDGRSALTRTYQRAPS